MYIGALPPEISSSAYAYPRNKETQPQHWRTRTQYLSYMNSYSWVKPPPLFFHQFLGRGALPPEVSPIEKAHSTLKS